MSHSDQHPQPSASPLRVRLYETIFEAETPAGRAFEIALLWAIVLSVLAVMLESVEGIRAEYGPILTAVEWMFTGLFTLEYLLRLAVTRRPVRYATSFFGIVDLLAVLPTYLSLFVPGAQSLMVVRGLRLARVFRILKLPRYVGESRILARALAASRPKITVFLLVLVTILLIVGAAMYLIEGPEHGFTSIPAGVYWAVVTMTTVGYGDVLPGTTIGKILSAGLMILGYAIIAVPTGIVTSEIAAAQRAVIAAPKPVTTQTCPACHRQGHDVDAVHCKFCGSKL